MGCGGKQSETNNHQPGLGRPIQPSKRCQFVKWKRPESPSTCNTIQMTTKVRREFIRRVAMALLHVSEENELPGRTILDKAPLPPIRSNLDIEPVHSVRPKTGIPGKISQGTFMSPNNRNRLPKLTSTGILPPAVYKLPELGEEDLKVESDGEKSSRNSQDFNKITDIIEQESVRDSMDSEPEIEVNKEEADGKEEEGKATFYLGQESRALSPKSPLKEQKPEVGETPNSLLEQSPWRRLGCQNSRKPSRQRQTFSSSWRRWNLQSIECKVPQGRGKVEVSNVNDFKPSSVQTFSCFSTKPISIPQSKIQRVQHQRSPHESHLWPMFQRLLLNHRQSESETDVPAATTVEAAVVVEPQQAEKPASVNDNESTSGSYDHYFDKLEQIRLNNGPSNFGLLVAGDFVEPSEKGDADDEKGRRGQRRRRAAAIVPTVMLTYRSPTWETILLKRKESLPKI